MKKLTKIRLTLSIVLILLLTVCVFCGFALKPPTADAAEVTTEITYVFKNNAGSPYYRDQYHNADEIGFSLNTSDITSPYFDVYAFTYFDSCDWISVYLWLEGTTGPTSSTSDRSAWSLPDVGHVQFVENMSFCEDKIYLSSLADLSDNIEVDLYIGVCESRGNGEAADTYWENIIKVGTITKYVTIKQPLPVAPTKNGYIFTGWYTDQACTQKYELDYITGNVTLYAGWMPIEYYVAFNSNYPLADDYGPVTGTMDEYSVFYDKDFVLPDCGYVAKGFRFVGWQYEDSQDVYQPGDEVSNLSTKDQATVTFYALWDELDYTLSFDLNGGSGTMANETHVGGVAKKLATYSGTKTGYTFVGWSLVDGDIQSDYTNGQTVTLSQTDTNITLHAVWRANTYTINFKIDSYINPGVTGSTASMSMTYDVAKNLTANGFVYPGYTFLGWGRDSHDHHEYTDGQSVKNLTAVDGGVVDLYAIWEANNYTIKFDSQGGSAVADKTVTYESTYGTLPTPTRTGYTFDGWYTAETGGDKVISSTSVKITSEQTLFAHWTANTYTVTFNANGGTVATPSKSVTYDSTYGTLPEATRDGYKLIGWFTAASGGTQVTADTKVAITSAQTLYARWEANTYTVVFNGNGNTGGSTATQTLTYDKAQALTANGYTKTGYHFVGWATSESGAKAYSDKQSVTNIAGTNASTTLYALWEANEYTVVFNNNDGSSTTSSQQFTYDTEAKLDKKSPTREGHIFKGWATSANGKVVYVDGSHVQNLTAVENGTVTLYAVWTPIQCTVTFIVDGEVFAVVTVDWGTPTVDVIGQAANSALYEPEGDYPN